MPGVPPPGAPHPGLHRHGQPRLPSRIPPSVRGDAGGGEPCLEPPPAHRNASGRPGASPPGCSGCKPPGKTHRAPGSGRRCSCLWGERPVSRGCRCRGKRRSPRVPAGSQARPQNAGFSPQKGGLPSLIRVMASSFLPPLFPLSSSSRPDPARDKTPSAAAGTGTVPLSPSPGQHRGQPPSPHRRQHHGSRHH